MNIFECSKYVNLSSFVFEHGEAPAAQVEKTSEGGPATSEKEVKKDPKAAAEAAVSAGTSKLDKVKTAHQNQVWERDRNLGVERKYTLSRSFVDNKSNNFPAREFPDVFRIHIVGEKSEKVVAAIISKQEALNKKLAAVGDKNTLPQTLKADGYQLNTDGILGKKTLAAVRWEQGLPKESKKEEAEKSESPAAEVPPTVPDTPTVAPELTPSKYEVATDPNNLKPNQLVMIAKAPDLESNGEKLVNGQYVKIVQAGKSSLTVATAKGNEFTLNLNEGNFAPIKDQAAAQRFAEAEKADQDKILADAGLTSHVINRLASNGIMVDLQGGQPYVNTEGVFYQAVKGDVFESSTMSALPLAGKKIDSVSTASDGVTTFHLTDKGSQKKETMIFSKEKKLPDYYKAAHYKG